ncbi:pullulanase 1, chloroplastic-like [Hibiscus syriacus]|uniref:pullulanase 1, chloroplastic-like n=1 Tax=Hibiscus syriacus TaxID=106335 RepID=UPI0019203F36|nr:pullulanase 1, chloroplastic-like [Hibiscus syriacus]
MAANLRDFVLTDFEGKERKGSEVLSFGGTPVGYALCPTETVNYVSAHENETLFDIISFKTPVEISVEDRCRMNHFATSIIALTQGIQFFHAGDEMLRSKSLDRDSYNSGDWFNRYSSPLFRLRTANAIQERVRFLNTGPSWVPGIIVMSIEDGNEGVPGLSQLDPIVLYIVVVFNASPTEASFSSPTLRGRTLQLHPIQLRSHRTMHPQGVSPCQGGRHPCSLSLEKHEKFAVLNVPGNSSSTWRGLLRTRNLIKKGCKWQIKSGAQIKFWQDWWVGKEPLKNLYPLMDNPIRNEVVAQNINENKSWDIREI